MTADEYIDRISELASSGQDSEALEFARRVEPTLDPPLSVEQIDRVGGLLEMSAMMVTMEDWERRHAEKTA